MTSAGPTPSRPIGVRLLQLVLVLVIVGSLGYVVAVRAFGVGRNADVKALLGRTVTLPESRDRVASIDSTTGQPTSELLRRSVIYIFSTECAACESQRRHIASFLTTLSPSQVATASLEPPTKTADYWQAIGARLPPPRQLALSDFHRLGARVVPTLVFTDGSGHIAAAWVGTVLHLNGDDLSRRYAEVVARR